MIDVNFELNGKSRSVSVDPLKRLSQFLRDDMGLSATKVGCNAGDCGSCTVMIDGKTACSCLVSASQINGSKIETVENMARDGQLSRLQRSFLHFGAAQCGICTPGMLMSARALLDRNPKPGHRQVKDALGGVLCRCTGYKKIIEAVVHAHEFADEELRPGAGQGVGSAIRHLDGVPKVDGTLKYGADTIPENALCVRVIRSPYHHARFSIGDKDSFVRETEGVEAFFDASDLPGKNCFGVIPPFADQPVFAKDVAIFRGEAVAAIVGEGDIVRRIDESDLPVTWSAITHALQPGEAKDGKLDDIHDGRKGNILVEGYVEKGSIARGFANARHKVSVKTSTPFIEHAYIELEAGYCVRTGDRLELFGCTQAAMMDRDTLAAIMGLSVNDIRIIPSAVGGGFGSKLDISFQPYIALAAWKLNRPAYISYSRKESMQSTTKRHPSEIEVEIGCREDGTITAFNFEGTFNTGAYASWGPTVANRVPVHASGPYFIENYRAKSCAVHTNTPPSGAFRGFGVPQSAIALETAFDQLADKAGMDRLELRIKNALQNGLPTATGQIFRKGVGIKACLEALKPHWQRANRQARSFNARARGAPMRKGVGLASCWYGCGNTSLPNPSTIRFGIKADGRIVLHQGAMDIGQGSNTVITQIAADSLGVPVHSIELIDSDTDLTPDCGKTSASRQTFVTGKAAQLAGRALRRMILRKANVSEAALLIFSGGLITAHDGDTAITIEPGGLEANEFGYVFMSQETYDPPVEALDEKGQGAPYAVYGYGAQLMELSVDTRLGTIRLDRITTAHDVGKAINPMLVEGQIEGGVAQGIGLALMEDYLPGRTENLHDYLIPTCGDIPEFENLIIEVEDAEGPYGAKGLGEHVLIPTAPAILNALRDATGVIIADLPATPDKVMAALMAQKEEWPQ